jgi:hypothetical protein
MTNQRTCTLKMLPQDQWISAARTASLINPTNRARVESLQGILKGQVIEPQHLALMTAKYWGHDGVRLTVGFLDGPQADLRARILLHMNAWAQTANVTFVESNAEPQVRIARATDGYWSYLGTDILHIPADQQTMNLEGFTMTTPDSEFHRVVRHETGHTLGFPHEHMRAELVEKIDPNKALAYFERTQGWSADDVRAQVLTPLAQASIIGTPADVISIMCYHIPGEITKDGEPILGGTDIDPSDFKFAGSVYPRPPVHAVSGSASPATPARGGVIAFAPGTDPAYVAAVLRALSSD